MAMDKREQRSSSNKKARVESTEVQVKEEEMEEGGGSGGGGALVAAEEAAAPREELAVKIYKDKLHCPLCTLPLKPPIFECETGHFVCGACHDQLPKDKCYACGLDGAYRRNTTLEDVVGWFRILCPYAEYGCRVYVTYHSAGDHQLACPCEPCRCPEPGCGFLGSPPMLRDHLAAAAPHAAWPVDKIRYGNAKHLFLPASQPRRLLVAEEDDGRVFLVSTCALGSSHRGASVVCVRASGNAAAGPQYTCSMWATGHKAASSSRAEMVIVQAMEVPSSSAPGEDTAEEAVRLVVRNKNLHGASMEMRLTIRIEKVSA
ncbi:hypothetical protein EJB05_48383 [Eragrostis curvula]|uniref:RING-type E3 ubiquitin transferase n=1 Tax=Eragrostis curvula TaxID=38414 RepID=A0A5J9T1N7_9POAL|nr:hypothetical protein EJB05_48383 [Eragrostis curvula]